MWQCQQILGMCTWDEAGWLEISEKVQKVGGEGSTAVGLCFVLHLEDVKNKNA